MHNRNIHLFYAYRLTKFAVFHVSILVLFYQARGLSFTQVMLLQTIYYIAKVVSEAPTGAVADRYGRRLSLILASATHGVAYLVIFLGRSFGLFVAGEILAGVAMSLASGADSALAYDTLLAGGRESEYSKVEGRAYGLRLLGFSAFAPIGSWVASRNLAAPYLISACFMFLSGLFAVAMIEPPRVRDLENASYLREITSSANLVLRHRTVLWLTLFTALMFVATRVGFWTFQPFMEQAGLSIQWFGVAFAAFSVFGAWVSSLADRAERRLGRDLMLLLLPVVVVVSLAGMSLWIAVGGISLIFLQQIGLGLYDPVLKTYTNTYTPSSIRATVLSFQSLVGNLAFAAVSPLLGILVDNIGLAAALQVFALTVALVGASLLATRQRSGFRYPDGGV